MERPGRGLAAAGFHVLLAGSVERSGPHRVAPTVSFAREGGVRVVIDPGMLPLPGATAPSGSGSTARCRRARLPR